MKLRPPMVAGLAWCLAWCLFGLVGCSGTSGGAGESGTPGSVEKGRIELPGPEPVPGLASDEWSPPPVWLVSGGRIVQGSYGEFCKLDDCTGMETPEQMGEDLATMRASENTFVVVGSDRVNGFAVGTKEWSGEAAEPPVPGVYTEPGVPPDLRQLDVRRVPEGARPIVEPAPDTTGETTGPKTGSASGGPSGGASVFELASTGKPGDRRLSVFLGLGEYDRAVYHWRLDPGSTPEATSLEASPETTSATIEELTSGSEEATSLSPEDAPDEPAFRDVELRSAGDSPTGIATGEDYLWVLDRGDSKTSLLKLDPWTGVTISSSRIPDTSSGLEVGSGAVWLLEEEMGSVLRLDPASGKVVRRVRVGGSPSEVVAAAEGAVWVAVSGGEKSGRMVRLSQRTGKVVAQVRAPGPVEGVAVDGASGDVWAIVPGPGADSADREDGQLLRIDPETNGISERLAIPAGVSDVAAGGDAVWTMDPGGSLLKIDPTRNRIEEVARLGAPGPHEAAYGAGAVWVASVYALTRVDPETGSVAGSLQTGLYGAQDLAIGEKYVWTVGAGTGRSGTLTRVTP